MTDYAKHEIDGMNATRRAVADFVGNSDALFKREMEAALIASRKTEAAELAKRHADFVGNSDALFKREMEAALIASRKTEAAELAKRHAEDRKNRQNRQMEAARIASLETEKRETEKRKTEERKIDKALHASRETEKLETEKRETEVVGSRAVKCVHCDGTGKIRGQDTCQACYTTYNCRVVCQILDLRDAGSLAKTVRNSGVWGDRINKCLGLAIRDACHQEGIVAELQVLKFQMDLAEIYGNKIADFRDACVSDMLRTFTRETSTTIVILNTHDNHMTFFSRGLEGTQHTAPDCVDEKLPVLYVMNFVNRVHFEAICRPK